MNMSGQYTDLQGLANPPLRACRPQNVCGVCFSFWTRQRVLVPTDLPPSNTYCPVRYGEGGLNFPCLKVDDLMDTTETDDFNMDLVLIEPYPMNLREGTNILRLGRPGPRDEK